MKKITHTSQLIAGSHKQSRERLISHHGAAVTSALQWDMWCCEYSDVGGGGSRQGSGKVCLRR